MGAGKGKSRRVQAHVLSKVLSRRNASLVKPLPLEDYKCPVRMNSGELIVVCGLDVYGGYCPSHGLLSEHLREDGTGDSRDFPAYGLATWPSEPAHRRQLDVDERAVDYIQMSKTMEGITARNELQERVLACNPGDDFRDVELHGDDLNIAYVRGAELSEEQVSEWVHSNRRVQTLIAAQDETSERTASHQAVTNTKEAYIQIVEEALTVLEAKVRVIREKNAEEGGPYAQLFPEAKTAKRAAEEEYEATVSPLRETWREECEQEARRK